MNRSWRTLALVSAMGWATAAVTTLGAAERAEGVWRVVLIVSMALHAGLGFYVWHLVQWLREKVGKTQGAAEERLAAARRRLAEE